MILCLNYIGLLGVTIFLYLIDSAEGDWANRGIQSNWSQSSGSFDWLIIELINLASDIGEIHFKYLETLWNRFVWPSFKDAPPQISIHSPLEFSLKGQCPWTIMRVGWNFSDDHHYKWIWIMELVWIQESASSFLQLGLWMNIYLGFWRDSIGLLHHLFAATCTEQTWEKFGHDASLSSGKSSFTVGVDEESFLIIAQT